MKVTVKTKLLGPGLCRGSDLKHGQYAIIKEGWSVEHVGELCLMFNGALIIVRKGEHSTNPQSYWVRPFSPGETADIHLEF